MEYRDVNGFLMTLSVEYQDLNGGGGGFVRMCVRERERISSLP